MVGRAVGTGVGINVGSSDGRGVGMSVGSGVGIKVGNGDGSGVGIIGRRRKLLAALRNTYLLLVSVRNLLFILQNFSLNHYLICT